MQTFQDDIMRLQMKIKEMEQAFTSRLEAMEQRIRSLEQLIKQRPTAEE